MNTLMLVMGVLNILYLAYVLKTNNTNWRATVGAGLALNVDMVVDIVLKGLK